MWLLIIAGASPVLAQAAQVPVDVAAPAAADASLLHQSQAGPGEPHPPREDERHALSRSYPSPTLLTIIIATTALVAGLMNVLVTPWTMRKIAADQRRVADKAADAAVISASAANENAKAAGKSAEAAVLNATAVTRNSVNLGVHQVARLRQEWINDLRDELAILHSLLGNWHPPAADDDAALLEAHETRVRDANTRLARVEMLLNPRELESRKLIAVLRFLADKGMTRELRHRRVRWIVRLGQIVMKTEWDRVRAELNGTAVAARHRRRRSHRVLSAAPFRTRVEGAGLGPPPLPKARQKIASRGKAPPASA